MKYQAILFSSNGEFVTDFKNKNSKQEVWDCLNEMGSKWIYYPFCCVISEGKNPTSALIRYWTDKIKISNMFLTREDVIKKGYKKIISTEDKNIFLLK